MSPLKCLRCEFLAAENWRDFAVERERAGDQLGFDQFAVENVRLGSKDLINSFISPEIKAHRKAAYF